MRSEVDIGGRLRHVVVRRADRGFCATVDGREWTVDVVRIDGHTLSLLVGDGVPPAGSPSRDRPLKLDSVASEVGGIRSHEVTVVQRPQAGELSVHVGAVALSAVLSGRRFARAERGGDIAATGPQRLVAPMPGKIVRVLVSKGESVRARQTLIVIEAMKMENELRAARDGTMDDIHVQDGQSVDAGALLAVIGS